MGYITPAFILGEQMSPDYSAQTTHKLAAQFQSTQLHRPLRVQHYDPGDELTYEITGVFPAHPATVRFLVEKFVGGGFAGQVYRVKVLDIDAPAGDIPGLEPGRILALKILIPPSRRSLWFRNFLYGIGFQAPFQLQTNPAAARSGALWQKFIRRAARIRFGTEDCVKDIIATFVDHTLGSCGELSDWIDGRTWRLEVDDRLDLLKRWKRGKPVNEAQLNSPEYRAKRTFMADFVNLLHELGAPEFARQYEWSTCKSQPNCLKSSDTEHDPTSGLVAVDFRAGLTLLPFLPMSPGDFKLILQGLLRGSLVQFDRGNLQKLKKFIDAHPDNFADLQGAFKELQNCDSIYRDSQPDLTHNHLRLFFSPSLWSTIFDSAVTGFGVRNLTDDSHTNLLRKSKLLTFVFLLLGLCNFLGSTLTLTAVLAALGLGIAALADYQGSWFNPAIKITGLALAVGLGSSLFSHAIRKLWGRSDYRRHYVSLLTSWDYFSRALRGRQAEKLIQWHRAGRVDETRALKLAQSNLRFLAHLPLSVLPAPIHRILTDASFAREKLAFIFIRPIRLYFNNALREQWLRDMISEGRKNHLVTDEDADIILDRIKEPFIQKYLKSLAVHVCTLPVTQIVSVIVAWYYVATHPEMTRAEASAAALVILGLFQITPISPGSICRGSYVLYLVIRERNFRDYNIAVFLGFFKYVGYLAFPIQMAYRYPVLARFMAAHWATGAVHAVPVFGEKGALLEHAVFSMFYNFPLTIRGRMARRAQRRLKLKPRRWHFLPCALAGAALFALADHLYHQHHQILPWLTEIWYLTLAVPLILGAAVTLLAGGTALSRRLILAVFSGLLLALLYTLTHSSLAHYCADIPLRPIFIKSLCWSVFIFTLLTPIGALLTEIYLPDPRHDN